MARAGAIPGLTASFAHMRLSNIYKRKAVLSVAGSTYASNLAGTLLSQSVALKHDYPAYQWFEPLFLPGVHYLAFDLFMNNLTGEQLLFSK